MHVVRKRDFDWDSSLYECGVSLALFRLVECCPVVFLIDTKFGLWGLPDKTKKRAQGPINYIYGDEKDKIRKSML